MVLADWTPDANITLSSPSGSPTSNPVLKMVSVGNGAGTREQYYVIPTTNNVNGTPINNIQAGRIESWFYIDVTGGDFAAQNRAAVQFVCRYTDASNYYRFTIWKDVNTAGTSSGFIVEKFKAAVNSVITSGSLTTNITRATYYKVRCTWWVAAGVAWFRVELSTDSGATWIQQGSDTADTENFNTSSTVKVGVGNEIGLNNSNTRSSDVRLDGTIISSG